MSFQFHLGRLPAGRPQPASSGRRSLVLLGDFSARAGREAPRGREALARARPRLLDVDTLDAVVASFAAPLTLELDASGGTLPVTLSPRSLDDLHPDALIDNLPMFQQLMDLRRRLADPRRFAEAAAEVRRWWPDAPPPSAAAAAAAPDSAAADDVARLLGRPATAPTTAAATAGSAATPGPLDALLRGIVAPHILPPTSPDAPALIATVDATLAATLRAVLHHPRFQQLETAWRALAFVARRVETDPTLQLQVLDWSAAEFAADLRGENPGGDPGKDDLGASALYRVLVEQPAEDDHLPQPAALICCHDFGTSAGDAELLARAAQVAARAALPFIATLDDAALRGDEPGLPPGNAAAWQALRALPEAAHLALAAPRFLLRAPYGRRGEPIERFPFEEDAGGPNPPPLPWGPPALLAAVLLGRHLLDNGADEPPGEPLTVDDMPIALRTAADGDTVALPCTEWLLNERSTARLHALGLTPVLTRRGQPEVRWGGWQALDGGELAGPWSA
jgi:predicted component of type VI protein secretion system